MRRTRFLTTLFAPAILLASACSPAKAPGTWTYQDTETSDAFYSVCFVNEQVGWVNGQTDRSSIPVDENGNINSNIASVKPGEKLKDPLKENQGFEVLRTTDGGLTWEEMPEQLKYKIRSVWFADPQQGWALTIDRDILHSSDGGASWTLQRKAGTVKLKLIGNRRNPEMDQPEQIDQIYFVDSAHGWAWGGGRKDEYAEQPGVFLITANGGQSWNEIPFPFEQNVSTIFFLNAQNAWASTNEGGFYKTEDGGLNWTKIETKRPELVFRAIFFADDKTGWVAGRSGRMAKTEDGGRTWTKLYQVKDEFIVRDIHFIDRNRGWAAGDEGTLLYTPDGGEEWLNVGSSIPARLLDITFINDHAGWIVGLDGVILRYER